MAIFTREGAPQNAGILMSTMARKTFAHPSPAKGLSASGTANSYSPGAVLGTGDNADTYTPGPEAV